MKKIKQWVILSIGFLLLAILMMIHLPEQKADRRVDMVRISRLAKQVVEQFDHLNQLENESISIPFNVIDDNNHLLYQSGGYSVCSISEAIKKDAIYYPISKNSRLYGYLIIPGETYDTNTNLGLTHSTKWLFIRCAIFIEVCYLMCLHGIYKKMVMPFHKMKRFAKDIAMGNLERPLDMDRDNMFGAFTESFDIMREELLRARKEEAKAQESKKELVASLSHDIKTPVTAIKLISDILLIKIKDDPLHKKIQTIYAKADQIDILITDMFNSTLEELGEMSVQVAPMDSCMIRDMIQTSDYNNLISPQYKIEDCVIESDPIRLQQVITNIISNSYKYANTAIDVKSYIDDRYLVIEFRDYGPGIQEEEIPLIFEKFYRSKSEYVKDKQGAGLGLNIARFLMEKMGGGITCYNSNPGLVISISICLS